MNDLYGHTVGDDVIKGLVEKIKQTVRRKQDLPCRYGGEEFFILLPYVNLEGAKKIAENIKKGFKELKFEVEKTHGKRYKISSTTLTPKMLNTRSWSF